MIDKLSNGLENDDEMTAFLSALIPMIYEENTNAEKATNSKNTAKEADMVIHKIVKEGPEKFINELCIDACKILWNKNIYTKDIIVDDKKICIVLDKLSKKNDKKFILKSLKNKKKYVEENKEKMIIIDKDNKTIKSIKNELKQAVQFFDIQDVESGFLSKDKFLMNICDCEKVEGMKEYASKLDVEIKFDENKMEKTFEQYLEEKKFENLYVPEQNRIYMDQYYLNANKKYLKTLK